MQKPAHHGPGAVGPHGDLRHRLSVSGPCSGVANGASLSSRQGGLQDDRVALCWDGPWRVTAPAPLSCRPEAAHRQPSETLPFPWLRQCQGCITGLRLVAGWCDEASLATVHSERMGPAERFASGPWPRGRHKPVCRCAVCLSWRPQQYLSGQRFTGNLKYRLGRRKQPGSA